MTKQEEIKEWAFVFLRPIFSGKGFTDSYADELTEAYIKDFFRGLSARGVVIKVERELPKLYDDEHPEGFGQPSWCTEAYKRAGYVATKPLIEEE